MDKQTNYESYLKSTHRLGRIVSVITLVLLVGAPFAIGTLLGAGPDLGAVGRGFLSVGLYSTARNPGDIVYFDNIEVFELFGEKPQVASHITDYLKRSGGTGK